jgi:heme-degrading monooxygenase HmoA
MVAVLFEVYPAEGKRDQYLDVASKLMQALQSVDGFISVERFESLSNQGKILSLSFWRDETSVVQWRNATAHRIAQQRGRSEVFRDYRLRVVTVIRDYGMFDRSAAPKDSFTFHQPPDNDKHP